MAKSYKYSRSRKPLDIKKLRLRLQDAMNALEPAILGEEGRDYDPKDIYLKIQVSNALSGLAGKYRKVVELDEIVDRIEALEQQRS